ncbi:uncharacterized protein F5147DRAFT_647826 [Suillus discolor]|uniref:Uncharacterized protein n=1 Tax=Suillus discolor TaxID=1912936 RepID=A0A9P7JZT4_9AGAM|nr:uncharacterized protein F5147DRAFT_647826 [Suillus discolor]KAG2118672.1 hypothetical protein F5147DRAFT_647826 [Suillus discolor]
MTSNRTPDQPGPEVLDMGFPHLLDHPASNSVNVIPLKDSLLDMGFDTLPVQHEHPDQMPLDMGFGINPVDYVPDRSVDIEPEDRPLDMGFGIHLVHNFPDQSLDIGPDDMHLDMGFETPDLVYLSSDWSLNQLEPIGFVIQRAVGDLRLATHWLEMQRAHGTMSPEEASWPVWWMERNLPPIEIRQLCPAVTLASSLGCKDTLVDDIRHTPAGVSAPHFHSALSVHVLSMSAISVVLAYGFRMLT